MTSISTIHESAIGTIVNTVSDSACGARITNSRGGFIDVTVNKFGEFIIAPSNPRMASVSFPGDGELIAVVQPE